jgi:O-antigen ligase
MSMTLCLLAWIGYTPFKKKIEKVKAQLPLFLLFSSFFWLSLLGLIYTKNIDEGFMNLKQSLPFFIFPLIFLSIDLNKKDYLKILKYFSNSVVLASIFALIKALLIKKNNFGDYLFFDRLAIILEKHTTYFALFVIISITYFLFEIKKSNWKKSIYFGALISFLLLMLYLLSVRISVLGLISVVFIYLLQYKDKISFAKRLPFFIICCLISLVYLSPNFQKRFNSTSPEGVEISDMGSRVVHWKAVLKRIGNENLMFGSGTGDGHTGLYEEYLNLNFETGFLNNYNAHNQYLETTLFFGITGLFLLLLILYILTVKSNQVKDMIGLSITIVFIIFMITESILERHSGIVIFAFLSSMIVSTKISK